MNKIVIFKVFKGEDGYYVAAADDLAIYTQGKTIEELFGNIREAVEISIGEESFPPVMLNMDFAQVVHV